MYRQTAPKPTPGTTGPFPTATKTAWWRDQVQRFSVSKVPQKCPPYLLPAADAWWLDQLAVDIPSLRHAWKEDLKSSNAPAVALHFLIEMYLQDYGIPPETAPPDFNKLDTLLPELRQAHGGDLLRGYMSDIIRRNWGYPKYYR